MRTRVRSPDHYAQAIARSGVPLQLYWSSRDRIIRDQRLETDELALAIDRDDEHERLWDFHGDWSHTAEMRANRRLPRALARFGLLPWRDVPALPATRVAARLTSARSRSATQVVGRLDPDRQPHEVRRRRERGARGRRVRHPRRVLDQALDAAERLGELEDLRARDELDRLLLASRP